MLSDRLSKRMVGISEASRKGSKIRNLTRLMKEPELWYLAYANIYSNKGAITPGINNDTLDGFSKGRVESIIKIIDDDKYFPKPVKRVFIPKANGKSRPLGILTGTDKLVQESMRIILEAIWEPTFSKDSHGFRRNRSCHTALKTVKPKWNGVKWFLEFDIKGFFDNIDHDTMMNILKEKISDKRFLNNIKKMLKAGVLDGWKFQKTYSGTPQGGIISPILANIYLHELDEYIGSLIEIYTKGKMRKWNPQYQHHRHKIHKRRKKIDKLKENENPDLEEIGRLASEIKDHQEEMMKLSSMMPDDPNFRRLYYCRYADDFILGLIGSKEEANRITSLITTFLKEVLKLDTAEEKTGIQHSKKGIAFLGYEIRNIPGNKVIKVMKFGRHTKTRSTKAIIGLYVPKDRSRKFCNDKRYGNYDTMESRHKGEYINLSVAEIICTYNAEMRGLANYYNLAGNFKSELSQLYYIWQKSLFKTICGKLKFRHRAKVYAMLRDGDEMVYKYHVREKEYKMKIFHLKHVKRFNFFKDRDLPDETIDYLPNTVMYTTDRVELISRLEAQVCEYCGRDDQSVEIEVHHVKKLADLKKKKNRDITLWETTMIGRNRKTLTVCQQCHDLLHAGKLPSTRRKLIDG